MMIVTTQRRNPINRNFFLLAIVCGIVFTAVASIGVVAQTPRAAGRHKVSFDGYGPVKIGMTVRQAANVLGTKLMAESATDEPCYYISTAKNSPVSFMATNHRISRVDISEKGISTVEGASIGDSTARIKQLYPNKVKTTKHFYTNGRYLTVNRGRFSIIFETDEKGGVVYIRSGKRPEVDYVEGCS